MLKRYAVAVLAVITFWGPAVNAQDAWPARPVKVLVGLAPGGATDIQARLFSQKMSEAFGQQFVVENRAGAGERIAIQAVVNAAPDGYTVLAVTTSLTIGPAFHDTPPYDPIRDLAPVSLITKAPYLVVVPASSPWKTVNDLLNFAKGGGMNFGTGGPGTTIHLGGVAIGNALKAPVTIINYKGIGPALTALLANEIHTTFANPITTQGQIRAGKLRALAVTSGERSKVSPDLPTLAESGVPGLDVTTWHGWLLPKSAPVAIVNRLQGALAKMIQSGEMADRVAKEGGEAVGSTPQQFARLIEAELPVWRRIVKENNIKVE